MVETLQIADWALIAFTVVMMVMGLFRGFSGTLSFVVAAVVALLAGDFGWQYSEQLTQVIWMRGVGTLVASLLVFGLVRMIVKKLVNGLLAQPTDSLLGGVTGALIGVLAATVWAWIGMFLEYSTLATMAKRLIAC